MIIWRIVSFYDGIFYFYLVFYTLRQFVLLPLFFFVSNIYVHFQYEVYIAKLVYCMHKKARKGFIWFLYINVPVISLLGNAMLSHSFQLSSGVRIFGLKGKHDGSACKPAPSLREVRIIFQPAVVFTFISGTQKAFMKCGYGEY